MTRKCHVRFGERDETTRLLQSRKVRLVPTLPSNLHFLLQRFSPAIREHYGYKEEGRFVEHFGVLERTTREDSGSGEDGRVSKRRKTTTVRERPGLSPALLPHLLWNTVFLRLTDVAAALPPYFEEIEILHMAEAQKDVHRAFKAELAAEVRCKRSSRAAAKSS